MTLNGTLKDPETYGKKKLKRFPLHSGLWRRGGIVNSLYLIKSSFNSSSILCEITFAGSCRLGILSRIFWKLLNSPFLRSSIIDHISFFPIPGRSSSMCRRVVIEWASLKNLTKRSSWYLTHASRM